MLSQESKIASKLGENPQPPAPKEPDRDRLRDIIVVFVTYPLTPTKSAEKLGAKKPWLELISLLLKVALAAYALYAGVNGG